ncbi:hypothetical protein P7C70_g5308, partial [Phenoliferia sp. Uapishka_3]
MVWTASPETNTRSFKDCIAESPRDFVGYGFDTPADCWNGAKRDDGKKGDPKIVVSFVLNYEEGAEHTPWNGDTRTTEFLHEDHYHRLPTSGEKRDNVVESGVILISHQAKDITYPPPLQFEYGIRCGLPRILKLFKKFDMQFTTWACARALEVTAPYGQILVANGHEIACHGNRWRGTNDLAGPDEEALDIKKSFKRLQDATGLTNVPTGWFTGNGSTYQRHIRAVVHKDMGVPLLYNSDTYNCDLPYYVSSPLALDGEKDEGMLMIPYSLTNNDHRFLVAAGNGVACSNDWFELLKGDFDYLLKEGRAGRPKMMTIAMHNRVLGKPGRIMALKRFMEYVAGQEEAWVTTRAKIASHWREKYPYELVGPTVSMHQ